MRHQPTLPVQGSSGLLDVMRATPPAPIRIKVVYQLDDSNISSTAQTYLQKVIVPGAINVLNKYIKVWQQASIVCTLASECEGPLLLYYSANYDTVFG